MMSNPGNRRGLQVTGPGPFLAPAVDWAPPIEAQSNLVRAHSTKYRRQD